MAAGRHLTEEDLMTKVQHSCHRYDVQSCSNEEGQFGGRLDLFADGF